MVGAGILVYFVTRDIKIVGDRGGAATVNPVTARLVISYAVGGGLALLGLIFIFAGFWSRSKEIKGAKITNEIAQNGMDAVGTVTFVDKNYLITMNNAPIYSIIEYKFKDDLGMEHIRRIDKVPSDWVIRNKIMVDGTLKVKYLKEDPKKNIMLF